MKDKHASKQASKQLTVINQSMLVAGRRPRWSLENIRGNTLQMGLILSALSSAAVRVVHPFLRGLIAITCLRYPRTAKERKKERKKERNKQTKEKLESDVDSQNKHSRTGQNSAEHSATAKATNLQKAHHRTWRSDQSINQSINRSINNLATHHLVINHLVIDHFRCSELSTILAASQPVSRSCPASFLFRDGLPSGRSLPDQRRRGGVRPHAGPARTRLSPAA